jgi:hypothetical protein
MIARIDFFFLFFFFHLSSVTETFLVIDIELDRGNKLGDCLSMGG